MAAGLLLDFIIGDPPGSPHPVRFIGNGISLLERFLLKIKYKKLAGIILTLTVIVVTYTVTVYISSISSVIEIILIYMIFAVKSLATEAKRVYTLLQANKIDEARVQIGYLVSRDTGCLDELSIIRAAVETVSENIVDGVISPMFYLFIGGVPLAMAYKAASTLDSMVGYKNSTYIDFGWASARLDDVLNYIPARITGFILLPIAAFIYNKDVMNTVRITMRDRYNHSSPNSGHAESAVAGALGCQLGGPGRYFGEIIHKPTIGDKLRDIHRNDILEAI